MDYQSKHQDYDTTAEIAGHCLRHTELAVSKPVHAMDPYSSGSQTKAHTT